jgi:transposase-like protein
MRDFLSGAYKRTRRHLHPCRGSWHVNETYIRVDGGWRYLHRAVDGTGQTIDFQLSAKRDKQAARRFFRRTLRREYT